MSLKKNILANYISQIYVTLISILMVPLYIRYMGAEAYGLVGFYAMLQTWFMLLDVGLTPTMARETARFRGGATDALSLRHLLRALESIFIALAIFGAVAITAMSGSIAKNWLNVQHMPMAEVERSIILIAMIVALRWVCGLYRGAINGFECQVWLSNLNIAVSTSRFVLVILLFITVGTTPTIYFGYQLIVAIVEVVLLIVKTYHLMPKIELGRQLTWHWEPLRGVLKFSLSIAFTSSVWVFVTQTDKLILSKLLTLTEYAYFTLAVLVASGVSIISGPISSALLPRMSKISAEKDDAGLIRLYRNSTQLVGIIAVPAALVLAFFPEQVLWAWTGDSIIASKSAPLLTLYALGNGILALGAFPYYLQFAKGDLKLHLIGNFLFVLLLIPSLIWATLRYGACGAGYAWLGANLMYFLFWVPKVHERFIRGLHTQWLLRDLGAIILLPLVAVALAHSLLAWPQSRILVTIWIALVSLATVIMAAAGSSFTRNAIKQKYLSVLQDKGIL